MDNKYKIIYQSAFNTKASMFITGKSLLEALKAFRAKTNNRYKVVRIVSE